MHLECSEELGRGHALHVTHALEQLDATNICRNDYFGHQRRGESQKERHVMCSLSEHVLVVHDCDEEAHRVRHRNITHGKIRCKVEIRVLEVIVRFPVPLEKLVVVLVLDVQLPIDTK